MIRHHTTSALELFLAGITMNERKTRNGLLSIISHSRMSTFHVDSKRSSSYKHNLKKRRVYTSGTNRVRSKRREEHFYSWKLSRQYIRVVSLFVVSFCTTTVFTNVEPWTTTVSFSIDGTSHFGVLEMIFLHYNGERSTGKPVRNNLYKLILQTTVLS